MPCWSSRGHKRHFSKCMLCNVMYERYLSPQKRGIMFLPALVCLFVYLSVCLSVCFHDTSIKRGRIWTKFFGKVSRGKLPSVLWHCWLGGRKDIRPVKNWAVGCWHGYLSGARCRLAYGPADSTATHYLLLRLLSKNAVNRGFFIL